ncbi:hypothetical protein Lesp02_08390 [Lentzea sp. NBRC 105346]|uniref:DUF3068 domain-containing protein n=1 Tax=Lentzea sp. NBRC 105346 TaxID=3032205 RepID=UPI0024A0229D|nr:DUF3068 domain-containing protein [Lentzea sp. NBRC 105346]GLZ28649.1 hypothetical protein Lesp02_08390 [Lentzea sp. NBRC 105346]
MRRVASLVLVGLGIFTLTLGAVLRFYVYPELAVVPLDQKTESVAQGAARVFYPKDLVVKDAQLTATRKVESNRARPEVERNGSVMVWDQGLLVTDSNNTIVSAVKHQVCLDRHTNMAVPKCSEQYVTDNKDGPTDDDRAVKQEGLNYKFPFGTEQTDYPYFDLTVRKATTARFQGTETLGGLEVYKFVQEIPRTKLREQEVPGSLVNSTEASVTASRYYQNTRTFWVEPLSGIIVKGSEKQKQLLVGPDGKDGTVLLDGTLTFTDQTVNESVQRATEAHDKLKLISSTGPLVLGGLGLVMLLGGILLGVTGKRSARHVA